MYLRQQRGGVVVVVAAAPQLGGSLAYVCSAAYVMYTHDHLSSS